MRLAALQSVVCGDPPGPLGSLVPPRRHLAAARAGRSISPPSTVTFATASSSRALRLPFRVPRSKPARRLPAPSSFPGVLSLIAVSVSGGLNRHPKPARTVPGVSHALDGFSIHPPSQVYFTPLPRPGFALQGLAPRTQPYELVARRCPLVVALARRLQGLSPCVECATYRRGLADDPPAPFLSFRSFGFFFTRRGDAFAFPPSTTLSARAAWSSTCPLRVT